MWSMLLKLQGVQVGKFIYPLSGRGSLKGVISFLRGSHLAHYSEWVTSWCAVKIHQLQRQIHTFPSEAKIVYCIIYDNVKLFLRNGNGATFFFLLHRWVILRKAVGCEKLHFFSKKQHKLPALTNLIKTKQNSSGSQAREIPVMAGSKSKVETI